MAILSYSGSLGTFEYDDNDFEVIINEYAEEQLVYKNKEPIDFPPDLPEGLVDGTGVFAGSKIKNTLQRYPKSLEKADFMYSNCFDIKSTGKIPAVKSTNSMYSGSGIEVAENMPDTIVDSSYMYDECRNLKTIGKMSTALEKAECMFGNCRSLEDISVEANDDILKSLQHKNFIFINCDKLDASTKIEYDNDYLYDDTDDAYDSFSDIKISANLNTHIESFVNAYKMDDKSESEKVTHKRRDLEIADDEDAIENENEIDNVNINL